MRSVVALTCLFALATAHAAAPSTDPAPTVSEPHRALATELVRLMGVQQSVSTVPAQVATSIAEQIVALGVPEDRRELVADYMARLDALMVVGLSWETLERDFALLYAETFSEADLQALTTFFGSDIGRRYVTQTQSLTRQSTLLVEQHVQTLQPQIEALLLQLQNELRAGAPASPGSGSGTQADPPARAH